MNKLGIDIGGSKIRAVLVDESGEIKSEELETPQKSAENVINKAVHVSHSLSSEDDFKSVGLGVAGRPRNGKIYFSTDSMPIDWQGINLEKSFSKELDASVTVLNDGSAAAYGELRRGAGQDLTDFVLVTIGTGIGGGLVVNNQLLTGGLGSPGEVGHLKVGGDEKCSCGRRGCLELYSSGKGIHEQFKKRNGFELSERNFWQKVTDDKITPNRTLKDAAKNIVRAMVDLQQVLAPQAFVFGGGVIEKQPGYFRMIKGFYKASANEIDSIIPAEVRHSKLGKNIVGLGAALYGFRKNRYEND